MCVSSRFVIIGSMNRIGPLGLANSCETIHFISVPNKPNNLQNVCLDNQDGKQVRERLNVHGTNNFCTWGNVACFCFLVIKSTHSNVILVSWFSFVAKSYFHALHTVTTLVTTWPVTSQKEYKSCCLREQNWYISISF